MNTFTPLLAAVDTGSSLTGRDWLMIAVYFGILLAVAWWVIRKGKDTAADYFLAGRNLGWWIVGASIFASNIGSEHVVGLAGSGASDGVAMAHYELHAWCLLVLAWVFVPFYARSKVFTMPEFLEKRFSSASRYGLSVVSLITFIVSKIAVGIFAGGMVFSTLLPEVHLNLGGVEINAFWIGSVLVIGLTGLYTILGGMRAVAYNDAVQTLILITGSGLLTVYGLVQLGGWHKLREYCGSEAFNLWKPLTPAGVEPTWAPVIEKGPATFSAADIKDLPALAETLQGHKDDVSRFVWGRFSDATRQEVSAYTPSADNADVLQRALVNELNQIVQSGSIYEPQRFAAVRLSGETRKLLEHEQLEPASVPRLNRLLLEDAYPQEIRGVAGKVARQAWYFNGNYPWLGMLFCAPIIGLWYWCTDQYIVQRALGAPDEQTARRGSIFAAVLKLSPVYLFIIPGLICFALAKSYTVPALRGGSTLSVEDIRDKGQDLSVFAARLQGQQDGVSRFVWGELSPETRRTVSAYAESRSDPQEVKRALVDDLNRVVQGGSIYDPQRFAEVRLSDETRTMLRRQVANEAEVPRTNRLLLEDAYPNEIEMDRLVTPDDKGNPRKCQVAFPLLVKHLLPAGLRGVVVAALLSALMGSLAGVFNACSTLFTVDLYEKWKPKATQHQIVRTGRIATAVMVVIALAWIPVIQGAHGLYDYLQAVQGYLAPPIFVVFFFGVFFKRLNAKGCLAAMVVGFLLGLFRMLVDTPVTMKLQGFEDGYTPGSFLWIVNNIYFQYFSVLITIVSAVVMVAVSYVTREPDYKRIESLTFGTASVEDRRRTQASWDVREILASALVLACILAAYLYFRG